MFEKLYSRPRTIAVYMEVPFVEERLRYLRHCEQCGYKKGTLRRIACYQLHFVDQGLFQTGQRISYAQIEAATKQWSKSRFSRSEQSVSSKRFKTYIGTVIQWLRFLDRFEQPKAHHHCYVTEVQAFANFMVHERGLSNVTVRSYCYLIDQFFNWLGDCDVAFSAIDIDRVEQFVTGRHSGKKYCAGTIKNRAMVLRLLFRFGANHQWCRCGIAEAIAGYQTPRVERIPKGLSGQEISRLLATTESSRPADRRDRAILSLLIVYGLRASEVCHLQLDDIDWRNSKLKVRTSKSGRTSLYPLSDSVAQSIIAYLCEVRPESEHRSVFLTLKAPPRPLAASSVSTVVVTRLRRIGITGRYKGSHVLRHSLAQRLLDNGMSMKTIGDYLGHRSIVATSVYAKVNLSALREVALIDLGEWQ